MTVAQSFYDWQYSKLNYNQSPYERCSPNLVQILAELQRRWGGYSLGCEADRPIRDGSLPSSHSFGAAIDWRYTPVPAGRRDVTRGTVNTEVIPWLIGNSLELHVDAIHDYVADRIWRAARTNNVSDAYGSWWKKQYGAGAGMGEAWATYLHIETHPYGWGDATPVGQRKTGVPLPPLPPDPPTALITDAPPATPFPLRMISLAGAQADPARTRWLQQIMNERWNAQLTVDGEFGPATDRAVRNMQDVLHVVVDGAYGSQSATALASYLTARK